jgi:hypothetical protein
MMMLLPLLWRDDGRQISCALLVLKARQHSRIKFEICGMIGDPCRSPEAAEFACTQLGSGAGALEELVVAQPTDAALAGHESAVQA